METSVEWMLHTIRDIAERWMTEQRCVWEGSRLVRSPQEGWYGGYKGVVELLHGEVCFLWCAPHASRSL